MFLKKYKTKEKMEYIHYAGTITLKNIKDGYIVYNILKNNSVFDALLSKGSVMEVKGGDRYYHKDYMEELYKKLTPFLSKADLTFAGEDGALWKHEYREDTGWQEYQGVVIYQKPTAIFSKESSLPEEDFERE